LRAHTVSETVAAILEEAFTLEDALRRPLERVMREEKVTMVEAVTRLVERSAIAAPGERAKLAK
jgi:hypothetical protein